MDGHYEGVLPCVDCPGIWTEVTLVDHGPNAGNGSGTFAMTQRFTGGRHGGATITTQGTWSTIEWVKGQEYTGTLKLEPRDGASTVPRYFYCYHGLMLQPLHIVAPRPLERVIPPPRPQFGPLTQATSNTQVAAKVGDLFEVALPATTLMNSMTSWSMIRTKSGNIALNEHYGGSEFGLTGVYSVFVLKATAPGSAIVTFGSTADPARTVTFTFRVRPR